MLTRTSLCVAVLAASLCAQSVPASPALAVTINPNPATVGVPITVSCNDPTNGGLFTPLGCLLAGVYQGSPTGPNVAFFPCTFLGVPIPPCGQPPRTQTWTPNAPGDYWFEIQHSVGPFGPITSHFFPVTVSGGSAEPTLTETPGNVAGAPYWMDIASDASNFGSSYFAAASLTTDVGIGLGTEHFGLDQDFLFFESYPAPNPLLFFNFQGILDQSGGATIGLLNPVLPPNVCIPVHVQVFIVPLAGGFEITNCHHTVIGG